MILHAAAALLQVAVVGYFAAAFGAKWLYGSDSSIVKIILIETGLFIFRILALLVVRSWWEGVILK